MLHSIPPESTDLPLLKQSLIGNTFSLILTGTDVILSFDSRDEAEGVFNELEKYGDKS